MKQTINYLTLTTSIALLLVVLYDLAMWLLIISRTSTFEEAKHLYLIRHPASMGDARIVAVLNICLATVAGFGFVSLWNKAIRIPIIVLKCLSWVAFLVASWQLFSLL